MNMGSFSLFELQSVPGLHLSHNSKQKAINTPRRLCQSHSYRFLFSPTLVKTSHANAYITLKQYTFLSDKRQYARFSSLREPENENPPEVEIISKEFIKPATPTPERSRMYEVSLLDQLYFNMYIPSVYFYPDNHRNDSQLTNHEDLIMERRQLLKQSLSETLTRFYPLAGRIRDSRLIDCNDEGIYFVEAEVGDCLQDFLKQPDNKSIHRLLPFHPDSKELLSQNCLAMIQVNIFNCGGIAIGLYTSHKIMDGYSIATFLKAWTATARNSPEQICPSLTAPSIFPSNPALSENLRILPIYQQSKSPTKRFVFDASSLATLRKRAESSRVMAVMGFLWKCAMAASKARSTTRPKYFSFTTMVNMRERISTPMPPYCIGNIIWNTAPTQCSAAEDLGLNSITQLIRKSTKKINGDLIEELKEEGFVLEVNKSLNNLHMFYSNENFEHIFMSSVCEMGFYESDFGWGKPIWISYGLADTDICTYKNAVLLMDASSGKGIEAWVTLNEEDMAIFERDPELLSLASVNPSPVQPVE